MPAAHKYNRTKACLNSKSTNFRTFRKSNLSETSLFSFKNDKKKIDTKKIISFHLINKMKKDNYRMGKRRKRNNFKRKFSNI